MSTDCAIALWICVPMLILLGAKWWIAEEGRAEYRSRYEVAHAELESARAAVERLSIAVDAMRAEEDLTWIREASAELARIADSVGLLPPEMMLLPLQEPSHE